MVIVHMSDANYDYRIKTVNSIYQHNTDPIGSHHIGASRRILLINYKLVIINIKMVIINYT